MDIRFSISGFIDRTQSLREVKQLSQGHKTAYSVMELGDEHESTSPATPRGS